MNPAKCSAIAQPAVLLLEWIARVVCKMRKSPPAPATGTAAKAALTAGMLQHELSTRTL